MSIVEDVWNPLVSPDEVDSNLTEYKKNVTKLSKCIHHLKFLEESLSEGTVPKGLKINLKVNAVNQSEQLNNNVQRIIERCQISVMEELKAHYIQTCAKLETRIDQTKSTLACAPDETIITATYKEMETKVNSLNVKLDQRREKKKQGTSPPNVQPRRQYNRRTYQAPRQGNNPPYCITILINSDPGGQNRIPQATDHKSHSTDNNYLRIEITETLTGMTTILEDLILNNLHHIITLHLLITTQTSIGETQTHQYKEISLEGS